MNTGGVQGSVTGVTHTMNTQQTDRWREVHLGPLLKPGTLYCHQTGAWWRKLEVRGGCGAGPKLEKGRRGRSYDVISWVCACACVCV